MSITIETAGAERLDDLRELWQQLNEHHTKLSPHFSDRFARFTFSDRKAQLQSFADRGTIRLFFAYDNGRLIGQCVAAIVDTIGEILSIFVDQNYRGCGAGDALMKATLGWFDDEKTSDIFVSVVHGNERSFRFYERHGLLPASTILKRNYER